MDSWERTFHAYGPAAEGAAVLDVIRRGDELTWVRHHPGAVWWRQQPYSYLWSALRGEGRITPATILALHYLAPAIRADDFGGEDPTLRWASAWWIRDVVRAVTEADLDGARRLATRRDDPDVRRWLDDYLLEERAIFDWTAHDEPGRVLVAAATVEGFDSLPSFFEPLSALLTPRSPERLRAAAACAVAALVDHPDLRHHREWIATYLAEQAARPSSDYRDVMVLELGLLGGDTTPWLTDPDLAVRVCAALAAAPAPTTKATEVLRAASLDPAASDGNFVYFSARRSPSLNLAVAEALCDRTDDFAALLDSATAALHHERKPDAEVLAEPYLRKAFPHGLPSNATETQRTFGAAVADHEDPWAGHQKWADTLARTGLPADRAAWRKTAKGPA